MDTIIINGKVIENPDPDLIPVQPDIQPAYPTRDDAIKAMIFWINDLTAPITANYPDAEVNSWPKQEEAARAVLKNGDAAPAHLLAVIDTLRDTGESRADRASRIVANADQFTMIAALTSKIRSETMAALGATDVPEEWEAILTAALAQAVPLAAAYGL